MFYLLILILGMTVYLLFQKNKKATDKYLFILLLSYFVALFTIVLYISKDTFYYYQIRQYFELPDFLWRWLFFIRIDKTNIIRLMNAASLGILVVSTYFSLYFIAPKRVGLQKIVKRALWIYAAVLLVLYDPWTNVQLYYRLYPDYLSRPEYLHLENIMLAVTRMINVGIILANLLCLIYSVYLAPKLKLYRFNYVFLAVSYGILSFVYVYFISVTPSYLLKISKVSKTHSFRSIRLGANPLIYRVLPYFLIAAIAIITYCAYRLNRLTTETSLRELCISKEISASETTSKIFCHYIKNEVLAIQSELQMASAEADNAQILRDITERCNHLYHRIDEIHRNTKTSSLNMKWYSLSELISETLKIVARELEDVDVELHLPKEDIYALVDPDYMGQALHNIVNNSIDAMSETPREKRQLRVYLSTANNWIQMEIWDSGKGISSDNLDDIFLPFYSSHSYSKHWGVGLTLTYKVVTAHEGKIMVESTPGVGTVMRILLPYVNEGQ